MRRTLKALGTVALASVYLMQFPCTFEQHGFSMIQNGIIPGFNEIFGGLLG